MCRDGPPTRRGTGPPCGSTRNAGSSTTPTRSKGGTGKAAPEACPRAPRGNPADMAKYSVNTAAVQRAQRLIQARQYVLDSDWGSVQPNAEAENSFLQRHSW